MPLAVVGSNVVIEVNGKKVRGRQYPWGVAEGRFTQVRHHEGRRWLFTVWPGCKGELAGGNHFVLLWGILGGGVGQKLDAQYVDALSDHGGCERG